MKNSEFVEHVEGLGDIYRSYAPFNEQLKGFREAGIKYPISVRDASFLRLHGKTQEATRTCLAPICAKGVKTIITRISPLVLAKNIKMAQKAVQAHRNNQYPVFDDDMSIYSQFEKIAKKDEGKSPEKRRAIILSTREDYDIFAGSEEAKFFFQDTEKDYFNKFVSSGKIRCYQIPFDAIDSVKGSLVNYLWFDSPQNGSGLSLWNGDLDYDDGAFGVRCEVPAGTEPKKNHAEGIAKNFGDIHLHYKQEDIVKSLKHIDDVLKGNVKISELESKLRPVYDILQSLASLKR